MKAATHWILAVGVALSLAAAAPYGGAQGQSEEPPAEQPPAPSEGPAEAPAAQTQAPVMGLEASGELRGVDTDAMFFLVVGENDQEMLFHYDAGTEVAGETEGVQGLTGEGGTRVHILYRAEGERAIAERIELNPEGQEAGAATSPGQDSPLPADERESGRPEADPGL